MPLFSEAGLSASFVALSFADWQSRPEWPAVSLGNTDPVEELAPHVGRLRLIVLDWAIIWLSFNLEQATRLIAIVAFGTAFGAVLAGRYVKLQHAFKVLPAGIMMATPPMPKRSQASKKTDSAATKGLDSAT